MKNFFKKLAFVLALAMVLVSVAPATANAAAKAPSLKKTSKILYIGGDITGTISDSYRFYFNNAKGYTATWESLNEDVVVIEDKTVVAVGVGKAVVRATLTNKAGNEVVREATVWVKQNAEKVGFGDMKKVESPLPVGQTAKVNVFRQVGDKKIWSQNDMATCTDKIVWTSSDEKVATVDKWGTVTAVGAGEATITATATQPQGPTAGESASYKVTVAAGLTSATQKNLTTATVTFGKEVTADELKTVKVYQLVGNTKVLQTVKEFKLDSNDKTKATIELYTTMPKNTTYVFVYGDTEKEFVTVDPSVNNVTRVAIEQALAVKNEATDLKVRVYVGDVDVTSALGNNVTVSSDAIGAYLNTAEKKITLFTTGTTATVKAVFHTYVYENNIEKTLTTEAVVTCVDAAPVNFKETVKWSLVKTGTDFDFKNGTVKNQLASGDTMELDVKIKLTDDKTADTVANLIDFKFESSNNNVLLVNGNIVTGVNPGTAVVIVKYKDAVVDALTVTVVGQRDVASVDVTLSKTALSRIKDAGDELVATIVLKDQLGDGIAKGITLSAVTPTAAPLVTVVADADNVGKYTVTFTTANFEAYANGTYQYKLTIDNKQVRYFNFSVSDSASTGNKVNSYNLVINNSKVDTTIKADGSNTGLADVTIKLDALAANGYKVKTETFVNDLDAAKKAIAGDKTKEAFYYTLEGPDGKIDVANGSAHTLGKFEPITTKAVIVSGSSINVAVKAKVGTYKVTAHKVTFDGTNHADVAMDVDYFTVTDSQVKGTFDIKSNQSADTSGTALGAVKAGDFIEVKYNGTKVDSKNIIKANIAGGDAAQGNGKNVFIYDVTIYAPLKYNNSEIYVEVKVDVNLNITLK